MSVIRPNAEPAATAVASGDIFLIDGSTGVRALAATSVALRDANGNVQLNNVVEGFTSTATAAGTTTLTVASAANQFFTGTTTQTVALPVTSTLALGQGYFFQNSSTGAVTINSSGGNAVKVIAPGAFAIFTCIALTGTDATAWQATYFADIVVSGKVLTLNNSLTLAGTDGTVLTFPSTSATIARTDAGQTFTGTQAFGALTATTINGLTVTTSTGVLTIAAAKTLAANNSLTLTGTDGSTVAFGAGGTVAYQGGTLAQFAATTSAQLASVLSDETGTGSAVFATSPTLVTPTLGVATATSINKVTITTPAAGSTLTIANGKTLTANNSLTLAGVDGKTLTVNNSLTLAGTDATTQTFPATSGTVVTSVSSNVVTNAMLAQSGAATLKGNATAALANETDFTIQGLTNLAAPSATLDFIPIFDHVSGTIKNVTPGAIASSAVAGVSTVGGASGTILLSGALSMTSGTLGLVTSASLLATPANPAGGSTSATGVMMGFGGVCKLTPVFGTRVRVVFSVVGANSAAGGGVSSIVQFGTGTAPANGAALTGTSVGAKQFGQSVTAGAAVPFTSYVNITGLTAGTAYWFDVALANGGGGTATITNITCSIEEF